MQQDQQALFEQGVSAGLDPDGHPLALERSAVHATVSGTPEHHVTGVRSRWVSRRCPVCGHSFRLGDEVILYPDGGVVHDTPGLRCASEAGQQAAGSTPTSGTYTDFFAGLNQACPLPASVPVVQLVAEHPLLVPPQRGHARRACRVCGHTFRPFDHVVICPCFPNAPRCAAVVHRDPWRQLYCWDEWQRAGNTKTCLGMS